MPKLTNGMVVWTMRSLTPHTHHTPPHTPPSRAYHALWDPTHPCDYHALCELAWRIRTRQGVPYHAHCDMGGGGGGHGWAQGVRLAWAKAKMLLFCTYFMRFHGGLSRDCFAANMIFVIVRAAAASLGCLDA